VLGDRGLAEDAAQEAVLQAMVGLDRLEQPERFGAWLGGIGLNVCRRWRRDRVREDWSLAALTGGRAGPDPASASPAEAAETAEAAWRVRRAVGRLPAGQRAAVVLFYLVGMAHREVATTLGIGVGAVKTRLHKGRAALREELAGWWKEDDMATTTTGPVTMRVTEVRRQPGEGERPEKTVILLTEEAGERRLGIWVGAFEGLQIAFALEGTELPRPMAYQLMTSLLEATGSRLTEARVTRLDDGTFYGVAVVEGPAGRQLEVDARPSDILNLALLVGAPIRVDPDVLAQASESEKGARYLAEAAAYPDDTAALVAEFQAEVERTRAEFQRRR
jgi:RNA polymerase sigma factor (sigma-70 family)